MSETEAAMQQENGERRAPKSTPDGEAVRATTTTTNMTFAGEDMAAVGQALEDVGLGEYKELFEENEIDLESFSMMTRQDFQDLEIKKKGPQMKLLKLVRKAQEYFNPPPPAAPKPDGIAGKPLNANATPWNVSLAAIGAFGADNNVAVGLAGLRGVDDVKVQGNLAQNSAIGSVPPVFGSDNALMRDWYNSAAGTPMEPAAADPPTDARLFVYGIPASAMNDTDRMVNFLRQHFGRFGQLAKLDLTPGQGNAASCALVEFANVACAERCMQEVAAGIPSGKIIVDGHSLIIRWWQPRPVAGGAPSIMHNGQHMAQATGAPVYLAGQSAGLMPGIDPLSQSAPADLQSARGAGLSRPPLLANEPLPAFDMMNFHRQPPIAGYEPQVMAGSDMNYMNMRKKDTNFAQMTADALHQQKVAAGHAHPVQPTMPVGPHYQNPLPNRKHAARAKRQAARRKQYRANLDGKKMNDNGNDSGEDPNMDDKDDDYNNKKRRALCQLYDELLRRDAHCAPHHHPCSAMAAKRIFNECVGKSFEDVLHVPFFDVVKAIEQCPDLFSISYVPDGRAGIEEMKWRFRANGPIRKKLPPPRRHHVPDREPWE